jgi:hypothetical protein
VNRRKQKGIEMLEMLIITEFADKSRKASTRGR